MEVVDGVTADEIPAVKDDMVTSVNVHAGILASTGNVTEMGDARTGVKRDFTDNCASLNVAQDVRIRSVHEMKVSADMIARKAFQVTSVQQV